MQRTIISNVYDEENEEYYEESKVKTILKKIFSVVFNKKVKFF